MRCWSLAGPAAPTLFVTETLQKADPLIGQLVTGRYRVVSRIGEGGMGTVYAAHHEAIEKKIALKVLHREYSSNPDVVDRFKQEAISASRIKHNNVIDVFDFGQLDDGSCFIAMEFLDGQDLGDALQGVGAFQPSDAIRIILQVCRALGAAHARGVVHRDLKPENIFLQNTPEGDRIVKIVDFGIAQLRSDEMAESVAVPRQRRLTKTGMIFGTPEYMAPEQARGKGVDHHSDIYAAGVILYELLSGGVPFTGESFLDVLNKHCLDPVPPVAELNPDAQLSPELTAVVERALAKQPENRFDSMKEFSAALLQTPEGRATRSSTLSFTSFEAKANEPPPASQEAPGEPEDLRRTSTAIMGSREPTPLAGSATTPPLPTKSTAGLWIGLAAVLALAGAAWAFWTAEEEQAETTVASEGEEEREPDAANQDASGEDSTNQDAGEAAKKAEADPASKTAAKDREVVLHVKTTPTGAVVMKDGFQVCDATPCEVSAELDEAVTLTAKKGAHRGQARVLAQREQTVSITLSAPRPKPRTAPKPQPAPPPQPEPAGEKMCEVEVNGLKILRPCE